MNPTFLVTTEVTETSEHYRLDAVHEVDAARNVDLLLRQQGQSAQRFYVHRVVPEEQGEFKYAVVDLYLETIIFPEEPQKIWRFRNLRHHGMPV